jgi:hypothetical protein
MERQTAQAQILGKTFASGKTYYGGSPSIIVIKYVGPNEYAIALESTRVHWSRPQLRAGSEGFSDTEFVQLVRSY